PSPAHNQNSGAAGGFEVDPDATVVVLLVVVVAVVVLLLPELPVH
ncbi:hypothetical protein A2U01_0107978, partial [Trifolium medium]|nr:hypothetical protein [Trifolium medium]